MSIIAINDLLQLESVMDAYIIKDLKNVDLCCSFSQFMA